MGVLILHDPDWTAGQIDLVVMEHATTVLAMEIARLQSVAESDARLRTNLVLDLVAGADPGVGGGILLNRAQALEYDLGRPHRVVLVEAHGDDEIDLFLHAVGRAARAARAGSLLAPRLHDVILLADAEVSWDLFRGVPSPNCTEGSAGSGWAAAVSSLPGSRSPAGKPSLRCACRRRPAAPTG